MTYTEARKLIIELKKVIMDASPRTPLCANFVLGLLDTVEFYLPSFFKLLPMEIEK